MQERYQRAQVQNLGSKWKLFYWDYTRTPRQRRSKSWAKSRVPSSREAQRLADQFMEPVNERNNQPHLFASDEESLQAVYNKCRELTWPHLKNSTRKQYEENFKTYLLPEFGNSKVRKMTTMDIQAYFNTLSPRLSPKSIRLIHGTLRAALNQGKAWGMLDRNPAVGVKLPRKREVKPTVLLSMTDIRQMIDGVQEPTKSMIMLIVFASMRPGEALALRWKDILRDRIVVDERVYDNEFDDVKTDAGKREVPFDNHGIILAAIQRMWSRNKKFRKPDDLVFANKVGRPLDRHNLLNRHLKPIAEKLGLPKTVDFRSFRTMHASLMRRFGARLEVARDNMGHAGGTGSITLDVYSKTWWNERVEAVTRVVEAVFAEPDEKEEKRKIAIPLKGLPDDGIAKEWEPFWEPQAI
ncbi:MAG TPA: site-specific integrase [Edaphobacter sp.]|nr:site-specific integrase [Edaphobacter sp.]